jgi:clan AA aspartic protease
MIGHVDGHGRALVTVSIRSSDSASSHAVEAWIDTGFNGDLVLPQCKIADLSLPPSGTVKAVLADGSEIALRRYTCRIDWFGETRDLEVVANDGEYPLLGVGLLVGRDLHISYRSANVTIE